MKQKRVKQILSMLEDFTIMENSDSGKLQCIAEILSMLESETITKDEALSIIGFTVFFDIDQNEYAAQQGVQPTVTTVAPPEVESTTRNSG